jgi:uncharacterized protein involved in exopolysaccharide biosynthesis
MDILAQNRVSLRDFLNIVFKRKTQILAFFSVTVFTVAVATFVSEPTYEAASQLLVKIGRENLDVPGSGSTNMVIRPDPEQHINSELEILGSRSLVEKVVNSLGPEAMYKSLNNKDQAILGGIVSSDNAGQSAVKKAILTLQHTFKEAVGILRGIPPFSYAQQSPAEKAILKTQKALNVQAGKKSNVIKVSFKHEDPKMAATVVNNLINHYLDYRLKIHKNPKSFGFFQEQSMILKDKVRQAEGKLSALKKQHDITSVNEERTLVLRQEADLRAALNQTLSQETETENRIRQLRQQLTLTPKTVPQGEESEQDRNLISTLEGRLVELELKQKELLTKYVEGSRLVQNVSEEIKMVREKLLEQENKRYGRSLSGLNVTYQRLQEQLLGNEVELQALRGKRQTQSAQLDDYKKRLNNINAIEMELNEFQNQADVDRQNYQLYLAKIEESRIFDAMDREKITSVSVIEPARPPLKPVSPKVLLNMVLAFFLGGFGAFGLAFFLEYLNDTLERVEDVENVLQLPVLGSIPELKS